MTENEAIELFKERLAFIKEHYPEEVKDYEEALEIGIKALETIKKLSDRNMTTEVLENYMQFEDECVKKGFTFKSVIEAREKQIAKKPVHDGCLDNKGIWHEWNGVNGRPYDLCPNCNTNLCCEMPYDNKPKYCKHCGQRLNWSDEE